MSTIPAGPEPVLAEDELPARASIFSKPILGWVLYDLANTLFSYVVLTRYYNQWVIEERGVADIVVGAVGLLVSLALVLALPALGAMADHTGGRTRYLGVLTAGCCIATALLGGVQPISLVLILYALALFCFSSALPHYDALLDRVTVEDKTRSQVSGIGVAVGYLGSVMAILVIGGMVGEDSQAAFLPTAMLFALFSIPILLWLKDPLKQEAKRPLGLLARTATREALRELRNLPHLPWGRFLLARFLYIEAVTCLVAYMALYSARVGGFSSSEIDRLLLFSIVAAILGALLAGWMAARFGPKQVLLVAVLGAVVVLALGALTGGSLLYLIGPLTGAVLGSLNCCDRLVMLQLTAPHLEHRGRAFGTYALIGKLSSGVGPLILWGGTIFLLYNLLDVLSEVAATRVAVGMLSLCALAGWLVLRGVRISEQDAV